MRLRIRALAQLAIFAMGCGTATFIVQQYDGEPRPREQIAVLRLNGKEPVRVESLDGERLDYQLKDKDTRVHIELLPGVHELSVTDSFGLAEPFRFLAAAGHVYRPIMNPVYKPGSASFVLYEVDPNTDEPQLRVPPGPDPKAPARAGQRLPTSIPSNQSLLPGGSQPAAEASTASASVQALPSAATGLAAATSGAPATASASVAASSTTAPALLAPIKAAP